jgi:hypothetical protein
MSKELLEVAIQAVEYLKEAGIKKPHFMKHAEEVIKAAKKEKEPNEQQKITKHFDAYLSGGSDMSYTKIHAALKRTLKSNPDKMVEDIKVDGETIDLIEDLQFTTVKRFCEMCGINL